MRAMENRGLAMHIPFQPQNQPHVYQGYPDDHSSAVSMNIERPHAAVAQYSVRGEEFNYPEPVPPVIYQPPPLFVPRSSGVFDLLGAQLNGRVALRRASAPTSKTTASWISWLRYRRGRNSA